MEERSDQEWIHLLKQNELRAINDLWEMLFRFAIGAARRYQQEDDTGRDAAIAAYTRIRQKGIYQYRFACPFPGFCRQIVVNELLRLIEKRESPTDDIDDETKQFIGEANVPLEATEATLQHRLEGCLEQLSNRMRQVIHWLYDEGANPKEAAERLGLSRNNLNIIAFRARESLRDCLQGKGFQTAEEVLSL